MASFVKADKTEVNKQSEREKKSKIKARQNRFKSREILKQLRRERDHTRYI